MVKPSEDGRQSLGALKSAPSIASQGVSDTTEGLVGPQDTLGFGNGQSAQLGKGGQRKVAARG